jgi:aminopeptidase
MEEKYLKYAELLLRKCLNVDKNSSLVVQAPAEDIEFVRILSKCAYKLGVTDIYFDFSDDILKHDQMLYLDVDSLQNSRFWNKKIYDDYASKNAAFLMLYGDDPDLMSDIDSNKVGILAKTYRSSRPIFQEKRDRNELSWCIASVATTSWANKVFPNTENAKDVLWQKIFEMCLINDGDPVENWTNKVKNTSSRCSILNELGIQELHYSNSLGTNLYIQLSSGAIWRGGIEGLADGREVLVNMPTEEVFTTPKLNGVNGIVYSSKPLVYNGTLIEDFMLEFEAGKVVNFKAKKGYEVLKSIIEADDNSCMLGEVALVDYNSPISNSNIIFYETLFDENASCHLALGSGFPMCVNGALGKAKEELLEMGVNQSLIHVDFMIGTSDILIKGIDKYNNEVIIFENGNFRL